MTHNHIRKSSRILIILCCIALGITLIVPLWKIDLVAPQYPEGLQLLIYPNRLGGNVDIINGLNHYIGMKTLHTTDFVEFSILPYIIAFFMIILLITVITKSRILFNIAVILFVCFGIIAMVDFWKWEYDYGHNLNPDAAIIVPGMAYQPPLIGFKQLLNFSAYSFPAAGGWLFAGTGATLFILMITEWRSANKLKWRVKNLSGVTTVLIVLLSACNTDPVPITAGKDHCDFCKMTVSDNRFGAEIITQKGKLYKFDDIHCLVSFLQQDNLDPEQVKDIYFTDFSNGHALIHSSEALLMTSEQMKSPMGGNTAAFSNKDSLNRVMAVYNGAAVQWNEVYTHHD